MGPEGPSFRYLQIEYEYVEPALLNDSRIQLAQRSGGKIAPVLIGLSAGLLLFSVGCLEMLRVHVALAAHLQIRDLVRYLLRYGRYLKRVLVDALAYCAVPAGYGVLQLTVSVAQNKCKAVYLLFHGELSVRELLEDSLHEGDDFFLGEDVLQRYYRYVVLHLAELALGGAAHPSGGKAVRPCKQRVLRLQLSELPGKSVVLEVRYLRVVVVVVAVGMILH